MSRFLVLVMGVLLYNYLAKDQDENIDFDRYWDLKNEVNVYADLTSGGMEFGEQWLSNYEFKGVFKQLIISRN